MKPILKTIGDMLSSGEIIHISTSMDRPGMENGFFSMNPGYVFDESLARKNINIVKDFNHSGFNFGRRRLVEQFDKLTGTILRRYRCMSDACSTMGLPRHYLSYKVFGGGAKSHTCVFGWRELNLNEPEISDTVGNPVESYADDNMLRVYMKRYLGKTPDEILPWTTFAETFDKSAFVDNDYDQRSIGLKIKRPSKEKKCKNIYTIACCFYNKVNKFSDF